ncbi:MAG: 2-oxo acid dehydrogenase subunit E2 [Lachnospiraceae bacterium]|nr:2-oxo acid dehydrogenase subunit E2 [Lachnospiraceae bacterium]
MIKKIIMPSGGQTTDQSLVAVWNVKKGDPVNRGDVLLEVETDKATLPVESFAKGVVIDILVEEGDFATTGEVLAVIGHESDVAAYWEEQSNSRTDKSKATTPIAEVKPDDEYMPIGQKITSHTNKIKAMPNAKKFAKEQQIPLDDVAKELNLAVIKRADLIQYIERKQTNSGISDAITTAEYTDIPHTNMRRTIARRMLESTQNIPTFQITTEIDMTECIHFRKSVNARYPNNNISYNDIIMKVIAAAVELYPNVNAMWTEDAIRQFKGVHVGLAVSVENGLIVPVIHGVEHLKLRQIAEKARTLINKARDGELKSEDMQGGTITISNLGMYPVQHFTAILNPPEVCILALGSIKDKVILQDGNVQAVPTISATATFDHRVVDGAYGAQFMAYVKELLECPALLV